MGETGHGRNAPSIFIMDLSTSLIPPINHPLAARDAGESLPIRIALFGKPTPGILRLLQLQRQMPKN
jgi:hypothetical protein